MQFFCEYIYKKKSVFSFCHVNHFIQIKEKKKKKNLQQQQQQTVSLRFLCLRFIILKLIPTIIIHTKILNHVVTIANCKDKPVFISSPRR